MKKILSKKQPEKNLLLSLKRRAGRDSRGRITVRHKGGGAKRLYRIVDFGQERQDSPAKVLAIEYDPYRTSFICLLQYDNGEKRYRICPHGLKIGDSVICSEKAEIKTGNRMKLKNIPVGTQVYNIEMEPGRGGKLVKGAGTSARVVAQEGKYTHLIFPSTETRKILAECCASIGQVSFPEHKFIKVGKAGRTRHKGIRPTVRGTTMNPCDHPHGGGEGRSSIGMKHAKTPWGKIAMGVRTRKKKWTSKLIIQRRKHKKK
ncbi:MAG: 50S ribosomal protein L2 [Candidatus Nealsonbacteria bacterium RBG_13_38_11]|uniref:Large ribosomal subunit protein uL2 n=1 Tax=Candidatus Nealsonbacteria bacterium RBG_13_38_11 TaxID=1801662 RepID=A0A1G2DZU9_9BACT|nr:MAG: 50S ribosomal protein L2 [Candidatus Nealsonbacteria bacterium RBG_13_38_11]HXK32042.1 50S ribosomal protein L2 [Candidatus Paceibacterota bacterium]